MNGDGSLPLEHLVQAITAQLDRAQETMALKARAGMPLTFAVKDLSLDLRTHVEVRGVEVRLRPAGPGEVETSVLRLALTTITSPMIEENTFVSADHDDVSLDELLPDASEDDRRRLEWAGIRTVGQLREIERSAGGDVLQRVSALPVDRLRSALQRASRPAISEVVTEAAPTADAPQRLRLRGRNLKQDVAPTVRLGGRQARVLESGDRELLVEAMGAVDNELVEVETEAGLASALGAIITNGHGVAADEPIGWIGDADIDADDDEVVP